MVNVTTLHHDKNLPVVPLMKKRGKERSVFLFLSPFALSFYFYPYRSLSLSLFLKQICGRIENLCTNARPMLDRLFLPSFTAQDDKDTINNSSASSSNRHRHSISLRRCNCHFSFIHSTGLIKTRTSVFELIDIDRNHKNFDRTNILSLVLIIIIIIRFF